MMPVSSLTNLQQQGAMRWQADEQAWVARPEEVVRALVEEGFQEYKRETATDRRGERPAGGMWQGLDPRTGTVATAIWVTRTTQHDGRVFIEIAGLPVEADDQGAPMTGTWWTGMEGAVLACLARAGRLTPAEIGYQVGMSEEAVRSILAMLAEQGKIRIAAVELPHSAPADERPARLGLARAVARGGRLPSDVAMPPGAEAEVSG
jgi:hypothetical protein